MRKIRKRILAVAFAAVMLVHIPGTASYAEQAAGDVETPEIAASVEVTASAETEPEEDCGENTPETADDDGNGLEADAEKPEKEETAPSEGEGKDCDCVTLCTQDSVNGDCPVCGAEGADLSVCEGTAYKDREKEEETTEAAEPEEAETEDTNLCAHHKEHTEDCGFVPATENSEGSLCQQSWYCTYECRICPIEDLIAALPDEVTADNAEDVRARLDDILALYAELTEEEQEQIDLSRCMELQEALDAANAPMSLEEPAEGSVAKVEKESETTYVTSLTEAFADANSGATVTMLADVTLTEMVEIPQDTTFVLDLNGHTISNPTESCIFVKYGGTLTIRDSGTGGTVTSAGDAVYVSGTAKLEGGRFETKDPGSYAGINGLGNLIVTGDSVSMNCLYIDNSIVVIASLSAGTYDKIRIKKGKTFAEYLAEGHAYYQGDTPLALAGLGEEEGWFLVLTGITVKPCSEHDYGYDHTPGAIRHSRTCRYCGYKAPEPCAFTNGRCVCGAELAVELSDPAEVKPYTGAEQKPGVTVTVDGQTLNMADYKVRYANNINAGEATVTVTGVFGGEVSMTFSIGKATPTIAWENDIVELTYTGNPAAVKPIVTLVNSENYSGEIIYHYGGSDHSDMPANAGTYADVTARIPEQANYTAAESGVLNLTILPADQAAPAAPTATDENIKDTSITLTEINGAEYSKDNGATWQGSPTFTGLTLNTKYTFCARMKADRNHNASPASTGKDITTKKTMLDNATVTVIGKYTYNGTAQTPEMDVVVTLNEEVVGARHYTSSFTDNINAGTATVTITASADGDYSGSASTTFRIRQAPLTFKANDQTITYGESIAEDAVQVSDGRFFGSDHLQSITLNPSTINVPGGTITPSAAQIKNGSGMDVTANYAITYQEGKLTISYMAPPSDILYNNGTKQNYYGRNEVVISAKGYMVSESQNSGYAASFTIQVPDQTGTVKKTLYFSKDGGISDSVEITVDFDLTPPAGSITVGKGFWDSFLEKVSFGHYKAKEYVVTIKAEDAGGSGIEKTEYVIVEGESQYTDPTTLEAARPDWKEYTGKPTVPTSGQYAVYARLTDKVGNVTYISTDGILLDETPPAVDGLSVPESRVGTETAEFTFTVDEAADYYYVVLPEGVATPEKEDIMTAGAGGAAIPGSAASGRGEVTEEQITGKKAAVSVKVTGLIPGTAYKVHVTAVDQTVDLENGAPAGNVAEVETSSTFTMKKLDQAAPALSYKTDRTDKNNIRITIDPVKGAQYSFDGGQKWTDSNEQAGFDSSQTVTLAIRMKETATHNPSPAQTVTVNLAKEDRDAPPAFALKYDANGETDYTVTIPPTEGCEYSFDGENWSDSNVKTGARVGETVTGYKRYKETDQYNTSNAASASETMPKFTVKTPVVSPAGGSFAGSVSVTITCGTPGAEIYYTTDGSTPGSSSTRYTGAFTVTAPAKVRAIAIKEGLQDSAVAEASYTKQSGGGSSGGNGNGSGGDGSDGGNGGGNGAGTGGGNSGPGTGGDTAPVTPVIPPAADEQTGPGTEIEQAGPGNGNTSRPGSGNSGTPGNKTEQGNTPQDGREPFIKGADGRVGWDVIRAEEEMAKDGDTIHIDMNGTTVVPGDIFDRLKGRDITITFDMGDGILWSVNGKSITRDADASLDRAGEIDFDLKTGVSAIPVDIVNNVTGERYSIQISLAYSGEFGFTAVLSIGLGKENVGYTASLYYYNKTTGELEFICKDTVAEDGTVSLSFTHASDYVIAIDGDEEEGGMTESPKTDDEDVPAGEADTGEKDDIWNSIWAIAAGIIVIVLSFGIYFIFKRKKGEEA